MSNFDINVDRQTDGQKSGHLYRTMLQAGSWWYSYINLNTKNFDFFMKILSPWPRPQGHPRGWDGADKNFRPISTIMPNMNEIHQRVFKKWGLINFNAKTLILWRKDEWTEKRKLYTPTYFVCRGYKKYIIFPTISHFADIWSISQDGNYR